MKAAKVSTTLEKAAGYAVKYQLNYYGKTVGNLFTQKLTTGSMDLAEAKRAAAIDSLILFTGDAAKYVRTNWSSIKEGIRNTAAGIKDKVTGFAASAKQKAGSLFGKADDLAGSLSYRNFWDNELGAIDLSKLSKNSNGSTSSLLKRQPVDIELKYKEGWNSIQKAEADAKVKALSEATTIKTPAKRSGTSASSRYKSAYGKQSVPTGYDVDHTIDLQLGGADDILNMNPLDSSVNRSLGVQIMNKIKDYDIGTVFDKFTIR